VEVLSLFILIVLGAFIATLYGVVRFRRVLEERKAERERALAKLIKSRNNLTSEFPGTSSRNLKTYDKNRYDKNRREV